jgi:hypothetical protein
LPRKQWLFGSLAGAFLTLLGAVTITVYFFIGQHLRKVLSLVPYALIAYSTSALFLLIYSLALGYPLTGYPSMVRFSVSAASDIDFGTSLIYH